MCSSLHVLFNILIGSEQSDAILLCPLFSRPNKILLRAISHQPSKTHYLAATHRYPRALFVYAPIRPPSWWLPALSEDLATCMPQRCVAIRANTFLSKTAEQDLLRCSSTAAPLLAGTKFKPSCRIASEANKNEMDLSCGQPGHHCPLRPNGCTVKEFSQRSHRL